MSRGGHVERRTFVQGAFGLAACVLGGGLAALTVARETSHEDGFVTPEVMSPELCEGPVMQSGIRLVTGDGDVVSGYYGDTKLFTVDGQGAELMRLADGSRTIDDLTDSLGGLARPADVASFFVTLGQAGYLQNTVLVNLLENPE